MLGNDPRSPEPTSITSAPEVTLRLTQAPGGRQYEVSGLDGARFVVAIGDDGEREMVLLTEEDDEPVLTLALTDAQAHALASALADALGTDPTAVSSRAAPAPS